MHDKQPNLLIILFGFCSSAVAVVLVTLLNMANINVMGWHFWFIVPVGAILVGVLSGLGYAIGSWLFHVKIRNDFVVILVVVGVVTYALSHFVTYLFLLRQNHMTLADFSFLNYIQAAAEESTFQTTSANAQPFRLGAWGYLFLLLELVGFCIGCLVPTLVLGSRPYCDECQQYLPKVKTIFLIAEGTKKDLKAAKGKKEKGALLERTIQEALWRFNDWWGRTQTASWQQMEEWFQFWQDVRPKNALAQVQCDLYLCQSCESWHVRAILSNLTVQGTAASKQIHDSRVVPDNSTGMPPAPMQYPPPPPFPPPPSGDDRITRG